MSTLLATSTGVEQLSPRDAAGMAISIEVFTSGVLPMFAEAGVKVPCRSPPTPYYTNSSVYTFPNSIAGAS
jgi:hypothetical protein